MDDVQIYRDRDFSECRPFDGDVEGARFERCDFSQSDLDDLNLIDCTFVACNLSMATVAGTTFQEVCFEHCKLLGLAFSQCNDFAMALVFEECQLSMCSFRDLQMGKVRFERSVLREANFEQTDLEGAQFRDCDLSQAQFGGTNLEGADLRGARNYVIDPEQNRLQGAKFSRSGLEGLLYKYGLEIS